MTSLSIAEALKALYRAAFTVTNKDDSAHGRTLIHCQMGGFGADWDTHAAMALLGHADKIYWTRHLIEHDLIVEVDGKRYAFAVKWADRDKPPAEAIVEEEPDPSDPRQITVSLMLDAARDLNDINEALPHELAELGIDLADGEVEQLKATIIELAETANITIELRADGAQ